jgi:hypothetical protein
MVPEQEGQDEAQANGGRLRAAPPLVRPPHRRQRAPQARPRRAPGGVCGQRRLPLLLRQEDGRRCRRRRRGVIDDQEIILITTIYIYSRMEFNAEFYFFVYREEGWSL